jgi:hypothetical protein
VKRQSLIIAMIMLLVSANVALAHKPIFVPPLSNTTREQSVRIPNPDVSWAVYAQLTQPKEINYYTFSGRRGQTVEISMSVPKVESLRDFGVSVALIGAGFQPSAEQIPIALAPDEAAVLGPDDVHDASKIFNEDFTQTVYWTRQTLRAELLSDGSYTIAVFNAHGQVGKYVLAIGKREEFGAEDLVNFPRIRAAVQRWVSVAVDSPAEVAARQSEGQNDFLAPAAIAILIIGALGVGVVGYISRR